VEISRYFFLETRGGVGTLAKAIVQLAAVTSVGLSFCQATYNLEGDGFRAPIAYSILHGLHVNIERGIPLHGVELAATRAITELMKPAYDVAMERVNTLEIELQRAQVRNAYANCKNNQSN
jgi:hypothetical protein